MNNKEKLLTDIKNDESVKRCHELERMIDENKEIKSLLNKKKHISKEMVAARILVLLIHIMIIRDNMMKLIKKLLNILL